MPKSNRVKGAKTFNQHYEEIYGSRWSGLLASLRGEPVKVALENPFVGLEKAYFLDSASRDCAEMITLEPGDQWLDLCSSPGGKALSLIFKYKHFDQATLNDISQTRLQRLKAVMHDYLPKDVLARIRFTGHDGQRWGLFEMGVYDKVIVDAPCSGERHLLVNPEEMERFSLARSRHLAVRQHALLCAALDAVKTGGHILYSTCSISPIENEMAIAKLLKKRMGRVREIPISSALAESLAHGLIYLPDRGGGGPLYYCLLEKI